MRCFNVQSLAVTLLNYSTPTTDVEPTGSVIVEAHYANDYAIIMLIVVGCGGFIILTTIICLVSTHVYICMYVYVCMYVCAIYVITNDRCQFCYQAPNLSMSIILAGNTTKRKYYLFLSYYLFLVLLQSLKFSRRKTCQFFL